MAKNCKMVKNQPLKAILINQVQYDEVHKRSLKTGLTTFIETVY